MFTLRLYVTQMPLCVPGNVAVPPTASGSSLELQLLVKALAREVKGTRPNASS